MKVNVTLDDKLMDRIDGYAESNYMSRSGFISFACTQYLNQADTVRAVKEIALVLQKVADEGILDKETYRKLEDYERLCRMITTSNV